MNKKKMPKLKIDKAADSEGEKPIADKDMDNCCCDYAAFCPVHSKNGRAAYKFDKDSYIAGN